MKQSDGNLHKAREKKSELILPKDKPYVIRLDGNSFSRLTKNYYDKPFDADFDAKMNAAAIAALECIDGASFAL